MSAHAKYSPSAAHRWMRCPASKLYEREERTSSTFADEGTAAHELAEICLTTDFAPHDLIGQKMSNDWVVTEDMAEFIQVYINNIRDYSKHADLVMVEQRVDFGQVVNDNSAFGTADCIIIIGDEIQVHDLKYGMGVEVSAEENEQLLLYAVGAYEKYKVLGDLRRVRLVIHQPRLRALSEWDCDVEYLFNFSIKAKEAVETIKALEKDRADVEKYFNPGQKQCQWCAIKGSCPALAKKVLKTVADDFDDLTQLDIAEVKIKNNTECMKTVTPEQLSLLMSMTDIIEDWCRAVRGQVENNLISGKDVPGYKLVAGRMSPRRWTNEEIVEELMTEFNVPDDIAYKKTLITPTQAEKVLKQVPNVWETLQALIEQKQGQPSVASSNDRRPAIRVEATVSDFNAFD